LRKLRNGCTELNLLEWVGLGCLWFLGLFSRFLGSSSGLWLGVGLSLSALLGLFSCFLFFLSLLLEESGSFLFIVGNEFHASHERSKSFWDGDTCFGLIVLENTTHGTGSGAHCTVEHVDVHLIVGVFESISCLKSTRLIISAVRAGDKFSVSIIAREPGFKIVLHGCSIIKFTRHDIDNLITKTKTLVEFLRSLDHAIKLVP